MKEHWEKLLNPDVLRHNLINASVFLSAYEMCRSSIISPLRGFFVDGWEFGEPIESEEYRKKVLSLARSPLEASLLWFKEMEAISDEDIRAFTEARKLRNKIAHRLPEFLSKPEFEIETKIFTGLIDATHKVGVWWVVNAELPTSPDWHGEEIDESGIKTGTLLMLQMMMDIAYGNEPEEGYYYKQAKQRWEQATNK